MCYDAATHSLKSKPKRIFVEGLPLNVQDNMWMYCAEKPTKHLRHLAQYADTLMQPDDNMSATAKMTPPLSEKRDVPRKYPSD